MPFAFFAQASIIYILSQITYFQITCWRNYIGEARLTTKSKTEKQGICQANYPIRQYFNGLRKYNNQFKAKSIIQFYTRPYKTFHLDGNILVANKKG